ncbi:MAG: hypothetical protein GY757_21805 [bacterium]|nr:hypothetical protein [bacterium]
MKKRLVKSLVLNKKTVSNLDIETLNEVKGGVTFTQSPNCWTRKEALCYTIVYGACD